MVHVILKKGKAAIGIIASDSNGCILDGTGNVQTTDVEVAHALVAFG